MQRPFETVIVRPSAPQRQAAAQSLVAPDFRIVASASHVGDLAKTPLSQDRPILLIFDASDKQNEIVSQITLFRKKFPLGRIAVLADHYHRSDVVSAYRAGANAYFLKHMSCGAFVKILELVMLGETVLPRELLPSVFEHDSPPLGISDDALLSLETDAIPRLSTREKSILRHVVEGCSNKSIARRLEMAEATVKVHVKAIYRKIRLNNRTQAAIWAVNNSSLVWSTGADSPLSGDDGSAATGSPGSYLFEPVVSVNEAKEDSVCARSRRPVRKQSV
jgi:two-component system, NarL family, nitrate/nitrite response regulator NarL